MFSSPYSPFFTSGLLSQPITTRTDSQDLQFAARRGSLPGESTISSNYSSAFYATLQPHRDDREYRSFLSLDLAESQSMRSASLKRKASSLQQKQPFRFPVIPENTPSSRVSTTPLPRASTPLRSRFSRDSLRTIPSPKPAPSITLPEVPISSAAAAAVFPSPAIVSAPPRLPSIPVLPAIDFVISPARSAPSKRFSTVSKTTLSSVSTRVRRFNRSEALAALEGRCKSAPLSPKRPIFLQHNNFMNMSDDDDSDIADDEFEPMDFITAEIFNPLLEPEDVVLPSPSHRRLSASQRSPRQRTRRSRTSRSRSTKEWFPLKSFIDLHNDDDSSNWSWRSFIEIAHAS